MQVYFRLLATLLATVQLLVPWVATSTHASYRHPKTHPGLRLARAPELPGGTECLMVRFPHQHARLAEEMKPLTSHQRAGCNHQPLRSDLAEGCLLKRIGTQKCTCEPEVGSSPRVGTWRCGPDVRASLPAPWTCSGDSTSNFTPTRRGKPPATPK